MGTDHRSHFFQSELLGNGNRKFTDHIRGSGTEKLCTDDHMGFFQIDHFHKTAFLQGQYGFSIGRTQDLVAFGSKSLFFRLIQCQTYRSDLRRCIDTGRNEIKNRIAHTGAVLSGGISG